LTSDFHVDGAAYVLVVAAHICLALC